MIRFLTFCFALCISSQGYTRDFFEGTYSLTYKSDKGRVTKLAISVKDSVVAITNSEGGHEKYAYYILDFRSNEVTTVSKPQKGVAVVYPLNKLLVLYEKSNLKEGYKLNPEISFKPTGQQKDEYGIKMNKYTGEDKLEKISFWQAETGFNFNQLIPFLRLIDCWNNAQLPAGTIMEVEATNKISKEMSTVVLTFKKETVPDKVFEVPETYLHKNFSGLWNDEKNKKDLNTIVQSFAGF